MALYVVEIINANACSARAYAGELTFRADPSRTTNTGLARLDVEADQVDEDGDLAPPVALFATLAEASAIGMACRWNNQQYRVKSARGHVRISGRLVKLPPGERIQSCQEG